MKAHECSQWTGQFVEVFVAVPLLGFRTGAASTSSCFKCAGKEGLQDVQSRMKGSGCFGLELFHGVPGPARLLGVFG